MSGDREGAEPSDETAGADGDRTVTASDLFEMLADPSRRHVLRRLRETEGRVCVHELADRLAGGRTDESAGESIDGSSDDPGESRPQASGCDPDQLAIRLHHSYLPRFDDCGLVDYDPESHTVAAEIPAWAEPYLDVVSDD